MNSLKIANDLIVITSRYMDNNTYVIFKGKEAIVIDPSFSGADVVNSIPKDIDVVAVLLTHAHFDHCFDTATILHKWNVPVYLHEGDKETYYKYRYDNLADMKTEDFSKNIIWFNSKELKVGNFIVDVMHTPGHSGGSVTYIYNDYVFSGDILFYNSYGRTDLGNSSQKEIIKSLSRLWRTLKPTQLVLPGHSKWGSFKQIERDNFMVQELIEK